MKSLVLAFIPICVAVDAIGNVPIFISLVDKIHGSKRRKVIIDAAATSTSIAVIFMLGGKIILRLLGVTISDFQVAGGAFLFIIAVRLLFPGEHKKISNAEDDKEIGVFPLGTPLITGPAVLTTVLMMVDQYGVYITSVSVVLNMAIMWFTMIHADKVMNAIGPSGTRAFSKIMYILLGAIGVMMMRHGLTAMIK